MSRRSRDLVVRKIWPYITSGSTGMSSSNSNGHISLSCSICISKQSLMVQGPHRSSFSSSWMVWSTIKVLAGVDWLSIFLGFLVASTTKNARQLLFSLSILKWTVDRSGFMYPTNFSRDSLYSCGSIWQMYHWHISATASMMLFWVASSRSVPYICWHNWWQQWSYRQAILLLFFLFLEV